MEMITIPKSEYEALLNSNKELQEKVKILEEKILDLHQRIFGKKKDLVDENNKHTGRNSKDHKPKGKLGRKPIDKSGVDCIKGF